MSGGEGLQRDQLAALMVAELDAKLRGRGAITPLEWSDAEHRDREAVELIAVDAAGGTVAVEHTRIESYPGQIRDRALLRELFPLGGPYLPEVPEAGHFRLGLKVTALVDSRRDA